MSKELQTLAQGENFKAVNAGPWAEIAQYVTGPFQGKVFLKEALGTTGSEISFGAMPEGAAVPFFHTHKENEEVYIVLQGQGQMQIDGEVFDIKEGSVVRVSPKGVRNIKAGKGGLVFMCMQAKAGSLQEWTGDDAASAEAEAKWK
ncbi:MAG TPA: cupin domain-containing protein [Candidatus Avelusimicrobium excrementipullorum]|nr:cupin domain-containing protein [Candidatus Avelusimicrobium excrementipullorum]